MKQSMTLGGLVLLMAVATIGCGQGFRGVSNASDAVAIASANDAMNKAEEANQEAIQAMADADEALKSIQDENGNINVNLFKKSSSTSVASAGLLAPVVNKLRTAFDKVFAKVEMVKEKFTLARAKLDEALSKLSATDPAQAALIAQIRQQIAAINGLEAQFSSKMHSLASKLDLVTGALDKVISGATSFIPGFGFLANMLLDHFVMADVKDFILEIKTRLLAL